MNRQIPLAPLVLGIAGLIPPLVGAVVAYGDIGSFGPVAGGFILVYGALILSFLGGSWWGLASRAERPSWLLMGLAVAPSIAAWGILSMRSTVAAGLWIAGLILISPVVDTLIAGRGLVPGWWLRLRVPLSIGLAVLIALSVWWGR